MKVGERLFVTVEVREFTTVRDVVREIDGEDETEGLVVTEAEPETVPLTVELLTGVRVPSVDTEPVDECDTVRDTEAQVVSDLEGMTVLEILGDAELVVVADDGTEPVEDRDAVYVTDVLPVDEAAPDNVPEGVYE